MDGIHSWDVTYYLPQHPSRSSANRTDRTDRTDRPDRTVHSVGGKNPALGSAVSCVLVGLHLTQFTV